jgi:hypothetical protein
MMNLVQTMNPAEVQWSRNYFDLLALNATWMIPRSGLVFKKVSQFELALMSILPFSDMMREAALRGFDVPATAVGLRRYQQLDFETISERFTAAGIKITDPKGILKD